MTKTLVLALSFLAPLAWSQIALPQPDAPLPPVEALPDASLTEAERAQLAGIADPEQRLSFRITRAYVRICAATTPRNAMTLPLQPEQYNPAFVSPRESAIVEQALDLAIAALLGMPAPAA